MVDLNEIKLPGANSWCYENGYLTINLELFGKYLSIIFYKFLGKHYYFQTFLPKVETYKEIPIWFQDKELRQLVIISPNLYNDKDKNNYNNVRILYVLSSRPPFMPVYDMYYKKYKTLFEKEPLEVNKNDFVLYFGNNCNNVDIEITLGHIESGKFIINNNIEVIKNKNEIKFNNPQYLFIEDFIKAIFYYKITNNKPNLDEYDMDLILRFFEITREVMTEQLIGILKTFQQNSVEMLLSSNNVEDTLKLIKRK